MSQFVATTPLKDMKPIGSQAERSLPRLQAIVEREFRGGIGFMLAEPVLRKDGAGVDWYVDSDEPLAPMVSLPPELADYYRKRLNADVEKVRAAAASYEARGDAGSRTTATALRNTITYPGEDSIWIAGEPYGDRARIVIAGWGYEHYKAEAGRPDIGTHIRIPAETAADFPAEPVAGGAAVAVAPGAWPRAILGWLLWLMVFLLALAIAWSLIPACGFRLPFTGLVVYGLGEGQYCRQVTDPALQVQIASAQGLRAGMRGKEEQLLQHIAACVPPPVEASVPVPEPNPVRDPENAVRQALIDRGITPDENGTSVTLFWGNHDDLDLYLDCPSGQSVGLGNVACGARSRVDENVSDNDLVDAPMEHISAAQNALVPGHYKARVRNYRSRSAATADYQMVIQNGSDYRAIPGSIDPAGNQIVYEFDVP